MNFLKKLFGGSSGSPDGRSFYVYVRPKMCQELIEIRIDLYNDLSQEDHGSGYFVRKVASATRCPFQAEMTLYFDKGRRYLSGDIENGEFVTAEEYAAWAAQHAASTSESDEPA